MKSFNERSHWRFPRPPFSLTFRSLSPRLILSPFPPNSFSSRSFLFTQLFASTPRLITFSENCVNFFSVPADDGAQRRAENGDDNPTFGTALSRFDMRAGGNKKFYIALFLEAAVTRLAFAFS